MKKKVVGVGGIFLKSRNPESLNAWYSKYLGIKTNKNGALFEFRNSEDPSIKNYLQFSPFNEDTRYLDPSTKDFMVNFRVEGLEALLEDLKVAGINQIGEIMREDYGLFAHIMDPEGNKIELWEPLHDKFEKMAGDEVNL